MGYHVSIVNTSNISQSEKVLSSEYKISQYLKKFNFQPKYSDEGVVEFYFRNNDEVVLFYSGDSLWLSNPDEDILQLLIDIADSFLDGSRVRGDELETYASISEFYHHPDDNSLSNSIPEVNKSFWNGWLITVTVGTILLLLKIAIVN